MCWGCKRAAHVQNVLTVLKIAVIVSFILLGFLAGHGDVANFSKAAVRDTHHARCRTIRHQPVLDLRGL